MADGNQESKLEAIARVDAQTLNPDQRAMHVWSILRKAAPELSDWDLICFCAQYLGYSAQSLLWLDAPARHICRLVYTAHYQDTETNVSTGIKRDGDQSFDPNRGKDTKGESPRKLGGFDVSGGGFA